MGYSSSRREGDIITQSIFVLDFGNVCNFDAFVHIFEILILFWAFGAPPFRALCDRASAVPLSKALPSLGNDFSSPSNWGSSHSSDGNRRHGVIHVYPGKHRHVEISRPLDQDVQASQAG